MKLVFDIFLIVLFFGAFGFIHSFLASAKIKKNITAQAGNKIAFYRLFYNVTSVITFIAFYELAPKPDGLIYELKPPYDIIAFIIESVLVLIIVWVFRYMDIAEFLGISQINRYYKGTYNTDALDAVQKLEIKGPFKISRHPVYFFSILFLGIRSYMDVFYLVFFLCLTAYFYIGAYYEEKKLLAQFGEEYANYMKTTPKIFPIKFLPFL